MFPCWLFTSYVEVFILSLLLQITRHFFTNTNFQTLYKPIPEVQEKGTGDQHNELKTWINLIPSLKSGSIAANTDSTCSITRRRKSHKGHAWVRSSIYFEWWLVSSDNEGHGSCSRGHGGHKGGRRNGAHGTNDHPNINRNKIYCVLIVGDTGMPVRPAIIL